MAFRSVQLPAFARRTMSKKRGQQTDATVSEEPHSLFVVVAKKVFKRQHGFSIQLSHQNGVVIAPTLEKAREVSNAHIAVGWDTSEIIETSIITETEPLNVQPPQSPNWDTAPWTRAESLCRPASSTPVKREDV
jgi:hypothetical protein